MGKRKRREQTPVLPSAPPPRSIDWKLIVAIVSVCITIGFSTLAYRLSSHIAAMNEAAAENRLVSEAPPINVVWNSNYHYYCAFPHEQPEADRARAVSSTFSVENVGTLPLERFSIDVYATLSQDSFLHPAAPAKGIFIAKTNLDSTGGALPAGRSMEIDVVDALRRAGFPIEALMPGGAETYVSAKQAQGSLGPQFDLPPIAVKTDTPVLRAGWRALYFRLAVTFFSRGTEYTHTFIGMMGLGYPADAKLSKAMWEADFMEQVGPALLKSAGKSRQVLIPQPVHVTTNFDSYAGTNDRYYTIQLDGREPNLRSKVGFWLSEMRASYWEPRRRELPGSFEVPPPDAAGAESAAMGLR